VCTFFVDFFFHRFCANEKEKRIRVRGRRIFARLGPRKSKNRADADAIPSGVGVFAHGLGRASQACLYIIIIMYCTRSAIIILCESARLPSMFFVDRGTSQSSFLCIYIYSFLFAHCSRQREHSLLYVM
jgi:hypothetical protein